MSMTREEAYEVLKRKNVLPNYKVNEAINFALFALRPVSRERVEKVFSGCPYCKSDSEGYVKKFGAYSIQNGELNTGHCKPQKINFCPHCSRPLTDEAVEMVIARLEALYGE